MNITKKDIDSLNAVVTVDIKKDMKSNTNPSSEPHRTSAIELYTLHGRQPHHQKCGLGRQHNESKWRDQRRNQCELHLLVGDRDRAQDQPVGLRPADRIHRTQC